MRIATASFFLAAALGAADARADGPSRPADQQAAPQAPDARIEALMRALDRAVRELPGYAPPEVNARGDIVIRRREVPAAPAVRRRAPDEAQI